MSAGWQVGDRALCVDGSPGEIDDGTPFNVQAGTIYLVHGIVYGTKAIGLSVRAQEALVGDGWRADRFHKVIPLCDRLPQEESELRPHEGFWEGRPDLP